MALSDACFAFLAEIKSARSEQGREHAALTLASAVTVYSKPPFKYGDEINTLASACNAFIEGRSVGNDDPLERLMFLAEAIQEGLDMPPAIRGKTGE